jgi:hypothetical protein
MFDAYQRPMTDVFDLNARTWTFNAEPSAALALTDLPVPKKTASLKRHFALAHDAKYWDIATRGYDWSSEDRIDADAYNRVLWEGLRGGNPSPTSRSATP